MNREYCGVRVSRSLRLAIPLINLEEIIQVKFADISPIPGIANTILGAVHQKGKLLWVLNLEAYLGLKPTPFGSSILAVILTEVFTNQMAEQQKEPKRIACRILGIERTLAARDAEIIRLPPRLPTLAQSILKGVFKQDAFTGAVLDPQSLFVSLNPEA
ncbi:MAG: chemotaxis protein CheW [Pseudanabaenaceae cyanobacterium bins.68]|nr:chemotaxis protein CheW [Pseudanabaenaceae cyanobacterium bins.68]